MGVTAVQNKDALTAGYQWVIAASVRDLDLCLTDAVAPVVTVTLPNGTTATPTVERLALGTYRAAYTVASTGRYVGSVAAAGYGTANLAVYVSASTAEAGMPTLVDLVGDPEDPEDLGYLGQHSQADATVQRALDAEASAQRAVCRIGPVYPPDLREALLRRVQRNLAMQGQPFAVSLDDDGSPQFTPTNDPEVRRLERPYRKVVLA